MQWSWERERLRELSTSTLAQNAECRLDQQIVLRDQAPLVVRLVVYMTGRGLPSKLRSELGEQI